MPANRDGRQVGLAYAGRGREMLDYRRNFGQRADRRGWAGFSPAIAEHTSFSELF